jgi:hypothetical protein
MGCQQGIVVYIETLGIVYGFIWFCISVSGHHASDTQEYREFSEYE